jgi:DNA-binding MarR family transcriptional regulator
MPRKSRPAPTGAAPRKSSRVTGRVQVSGALAALQKLRVIIKTAQEQFQFASETAGISGSQAWALAEIARAPGMIVSELGKAMAIHPSTTSNMLDKMQKRDLIRRERVDADQRVVRLYITSAGENVLAHLPGPATGLLPDALSRMDDEQIAQVNAALSLILEKMHRHEASAAFTPIASLLETPGRAPESSEPEPKPVRRRPRA